MTVAFWDKIRTSGNVEDRRAAGPGLALGGGLASIAIVVVLGLLSGQSGSSILQVVLSQATTGSSQVSGGAGASVNDDYADFASKVLGSTDEVWAAKFQELGKTYEAPRLVLFRSATQSGCGVATSDVGPHYCPADSTIYLDETFFDALKNQLGGSNGDVAQAYVIAHEAGHNVQAQLSEATAETNEESVKVELQADCYAGVWAYYVNQEGVFEPNEVQEALSAAAAVGDDRIQQKTEGRTTPESWTHGSAEQRTHWFTTGLNSGKMAACDTAKM
jgi:predicted metalloprotease